MSWFVRIAIFFIHFYVHKFFNLLYYIHNVVVRENSDIFSFTFINLYYIFGVSHFLIDTFFYFFYSILVVLSPLSHICLLVFHSGIDICLRQFFGR